MINIAWALVLASIGGATSPSSDAAARGDPVRWVRLSAPITLKGSAPPCRSAACQVVLSGVAELRDPESGFSTGRMGVAVTAVIGQEGCAAGWARPAIDVLVEKDGRYVGGGRAEGDLAVTGCSGTAGISFSGAGTLSADVLVVRP